jgi:hypothetical protein
MYPDYECLQYATSGLIADSLVRWGAHRQMRVSVSVLTITRRCACAAIGHAVTLPSPTINFR